MGVKLGLSYKIVLKGVSVKVIKKFCHFDQGEKSIHKLSTIKYLCIDFSLALEMTSILDTVCLLLNQ